MTMTHDYKELMQIGQETILRQTRVSLEHVLAQYRIARLETNRTNLSRVTSSCFAPINFRVMLVRLVSRDPLDEIDSAKA